MRILIIGCGYTGARIARLHAARGDAVTGTTRAGTLSNVETLALDLDAPTPAALPAVDRVYYTAPPPSAGVTDERLARLLENLPTPGIFVYFSTTGVYGDRGGGRVSERTPVAPDTDRARRRMDAETRTRQWCDSQGCGVAILRIAGIYGPGRLPLARLRAGEPVPRDSGPGNRIHVDDLAAAAAAIADTGMDGVWNISDGNPLSVAAFTDLVADAVRLPRPPRVPLDSAEIAPGMRSFLRESRRVDNGKLLEVPGFRLRYPDPADGILASIG